VVVAGRDIGDQRAERVERRAMAPVLLQDDVLIHQVERDVPRTLDHDLHVETGRDKSTPRPQDFRVVPDPEISARYGNTILGPPR